MPFSDIDFKENQNTKITLFIFDPVLRKHTSMSLKALAFANVEDQAVPQNYFQALARVVPIIASGVELVLLNLPPKPRPTDSSDGVRPVYDVMSEVYTDIKTHLAKRSSDPLKFISKTIPMIEVGDYLREKLIEVLFKFRVPAAFFMSVPMATRHLKGKAKNEQLRENFQFHFQELSEYLRQYFRDKEELVALADEKLSEKELNERKKKYDQLMAEAAEHKEKGNYDAAIGLLRQAIEIYPKDIEAYLESGRLYVRRKEYGRALVRFGQAEDLFMDAPTPNKEIANVRLTQAKEKIEAGVDPNSREIMELLDEAAVHYRQAHTKTTEMIKNSPETPDLAQPIAIGQEILKWNLAEFLGPKHPAVKDLHGLAYETTDGLEKIPIQELSAMQCLSLGLRALEQGDVDLALKYYFHALNDKTHFAEICTEINLLGIRLRAQGLMDEAIQTYNRLLKYTPPNQGPVYWNLAIAHSYKKETLKSAGFTARCLYVDPYLAREKEFYSTLTPQFVPIVLRLMKTLRFVYGQYKKIKPPPPLVKLYQAQDRLCHLITANNRGEAFKLFLSLNKQAQRFILKPEFYADGTVVKFLVETKNSLAKNQDPRYRSRLQLVNAWLKHVNQHPAPPNLVRFSKLIMASYMAIEKKADQHLAAYYLGQALMLMPEPYFQRPDFFARENLPGLVRELVSKLKYVDIKRFPKPKSARPTRARPAGTGRQTRSAAPGK